MSEKGFTQKRRLLSAADLTIEDVERILNTASAMKEVSTRDVKKIPPLRGKTIINCFLEPSTRTKTSFEIAGKRLSADVINISATGSSLSKGETIKDMARNLSAMKPDLVVVRSQYSGIPLRISEWIDCAVVNAGDGRHEHPTQSLLDLFTIREKKGPLDNLNISIIGDILNSRVARSNIILMKLLGANITLCGPATLLPVCDISCDNNRPAGLVVDRVTNSLKEAVTGADVVMMLRIQTERLNEKKFPNLREYSKLYGLSPETLKLAAKDPLVLHPGPINRGVEISPEVADGPWCVMLDQVTNGVAVRMAVLYLLLGGGSASNA
ncbi:MAG: aspartate carbamoyltransferase catalytic subunit [Nitrospinae bacterium]|nr:aspartate carbamoyltransferase catalytic subunit [Nitrospinota bacterium]